MTLQAIAAAGEPRPESSNDAFTQMNALICKIHEIQALAKISGNYLSGLDYPEDAPNTPDLQTVSTVNGIIIDLVDQACTMVDDLFRALPKVRS